MTTRDEINSAQRADRVSLRGDADNLRALTSHPGWKVYVELVQSVGNNYYPTLMAPLENVMEATKAEYAKGTLNGLSLATGLPFAKIKEADELLTTTDEQE